MEKLKVLGYSISSALGDLLPNNKTFRRYSATLSTFMPFLGNSDFSIRPILYEVGRRKDSKQAALVCRAETTMAPDCSVATNMALSVDFAGYAKKFSNFSGIWEYMDLAGMIERLAAAIACESVYGGVTTADMRGGRPISVSVLNVPERPVSATANTVFIPRLVDTIINLEVFAVMLAAANGAGSDVCTDIITIDANNSAPLVPSVSGVPLANACVEALRIIGANYSQAGAGDVFAYAVTRGIHSVMSVVGHTDEGGYIREVLRTSSFRAPYGGIHGMYHDYPGLPALAAASRPAVSGWVDSIALKTAAAVAHCDPCTTHNGNVFPRLYSSTAVVPDTATASEEASLHSHCLSGYIAGDFSEFSNVYTRALSEIFSLDSYSGQASVHMSACASSLAGVNVRHLGYKTVTPYFWIEPTSLLPPNAFGTAAEVAGFASLACGPANYSMKPFEDAVTLSDGGPALSSYAVKVRSARTSGLLVHLNGHRDNGLGCITIQQADTEGLLQVGSTGGTVDEKFDADAPISSYLWTRGQSPIPAPGEMINVGLTLGITARHSNLDKDFNLVVEHLPTPGEFCTATITINASAPSAIQSGSSNRWDRTTTRQRTRASAALGQAVRRMRAFGVTNAGILPKSRGAPKLEHHQLAAHEQADASYPKAERGPAPVPLVTGLVARGTPVPTVVHLAPDHGPHAAKSGPRPPGHVKIDEPQETVIPGTDLRGETRATEADLLTASTATSAPVAVPAAQ